MKTKKMRFLALLLSVLLIVSFFPLSFSVSASSENEFVEYMLQQLEEGNATATFTVYDLSNLTAEEIASDPSLCQFFEILSEDEPTSYNSITPQSTHNYNKAGSLYTYSITDTSGNELEYYSLPVSESTYAEIPRYGDISWSTSLYVYEYVVANGVRLNNGAYYNQISFRNIRGEVGVTGNAIFQGIQTVSLNISSLPISIDYYALLGCAASSSTTISAIISALSSITYSSSNQNSYNITSSKNMMGAKFSSQIKHSHHGDSVTVYPNLATKNSTLTTNTECGFAIKWTYDVYLGNSKHTTTSITSTGTTYTNVEGDII